MKRILHSSGISNKRQFCSLTYPGRIMSTLVKVWMIIIRNRCVKIFCNSAKISYRLDGNTPDSTILLNSDSLTYNKARL